MALYYILKKIFFFLRMRDREDRKKMKDKKDINYRKDRLGRKNMKDMWTSRPCRT